MQVLIEQLMNNSLINVKWIYNTNLKQEWLIRTTGISIFVPSTIRISDTPEAVIVSPVAHSQIDLFDAVVCGNIQRFPGLANLHDLNSFVLGDFKDVQQLWERFSISIILNDFINSTDIGSNIINCVFLA